MFLRTKFSVVFVIAFFLCSAYMFLYNIDYTYYQTITSNVTISESFQHATHVLFTEGCKVPKFDPFDPTVAKYYEAVGKDISCKGKRYLNLENNVVILDQAQVEKDFGNNTEFKCTYLPIYRNPENKTKEADNKFGYGTERNLTIGEMLPDEFVKVICRVGEKVSYAEYLASTPIKQSVEDRCSQKSTKMASNDPLNIIFIGLDSISKLNFERHFKKTAEYLRRNLSTFEFHGYMKVADNTFPNLTPLLTGHFINHYYNKASKRWMYFDDLDFIWKNFSSIGYRTFYAEDAPDMGTYNYVKNGFQFPPTDYYWRPFTLAIEDTPWQKNSNTDCFQATPEIVVLFNYLRSFLQTMGDRPYFSFTWSARLTHGDLNKAGYADRPSFELLRDINDMGLLNKSVLVFLSDHGIRFGKIRNTFIGKIEERMPFLFMSFPEWFLKANPDIAVNLSANQKRLTTPFDVHETIVDLYQMMSGDQSYTRTPYGMSLLNNIPAERNCESAHILPHWCVCQEYQLLSVDDKMSQRGARALVNAVNKLTMPYRDLCEELKLDAILDARVTKPKDDLLKYVELEWGDDEKTIVFGSKSDSYEKLIITARTQPGGAEFESTIRKVNNNYKTYDISRINLYGNQSSCIDDSDLRKYCYCKENIGK